MMDRFIDIKQEDHRLLIEPLGGEINKSPTVDKEEQPHLLVAPTLLDAVFQLWVGSSGIDFVLYVLVLKESLGYWQRYGKDLERAEGVNVEGREEEDGDFWDGDLCEQFLVDEDDVIDWDFHMGVRAYIWDMYLWNLNISCWRNTGVCG